MARSDRVLRPYLECPDEQSADDLLAGLIFSNAQTVVRGILDRRLHGAAGPREREDLAGEVLLGLMVRLRKLRESPGNPPIDNLRAAAARAAHDASDVFFRHRYPQRHLLKNRARYVLRENPRFAIWTDANGATACGWARWKGRPVAEFAGCHIVMPSAASVEAEMEAIFEDAGGPVELDSLAGFLAAAWGTCEVRVRSEKDDAGLPGDSLRRMERLWAGILLLPLPQRVAWLLHHRDDHGGPALALLPAAGVANLAEIARALEMPVEELAELWNRLPLADNEIAARLGIGPFQVMDSRNAARERLARSDECLAGVTTWPT